MPTKDQMETAVRIRAIVARLGPNADYEKCKHACEGEGLDLSRPEWSSARHKIKSDTGWGGDHREPEPITNNHDPEEGAPIPEKTVVKVKPTMNARNSRDAVFAAIEFINQALKELMPIVTGDLTNEDEKKAEEDYKDAKRVVKDLLHIKETLE